MGKQVIMYKTIINKKLEHKQLLITRVFKGPLDLVWRAWTTPELLDRWWAPEPWKTKTKSMDFSEGGRWLYSMNGPEGEKHWCRADYLSIVTADMFEVQDAFCDEEGNDNSDIPSMHWNVQFTDVGEGTKVNVTISFASEEALEKIIAMGFKEGFTMAHDNLDKVLEELLAESNS